MLLAKTVLVIIGAVAAMLIAWVLFGRIGIGRQRTAAEVLWTEFLLTLVYFLAGAALFLAVWWIGTLVTMGGQ